MKKQAIKTIIASIAIALFAVTGTGIVQAADGDHTPRKELWENKTGNTPRYYELDLVRSLAKEDLKTAEEAMNYWVKEYQSFGMSAERINILLNYKKEILRGVIRKEFLSVLNYNIAKNSFNNLLKEVQSGNLPRLSIKSTESSSTNMSTPEKPVLTTDQGTSNNSNTSNTSTQNEPSSFNSAPEVEQPIYTGRNIYAKKLSRSLQEKFVLMESRIERIIRTKLAPKFASYSESKRLALRTGFNNKLNAMQSKETKSMMKAVIEEVRLQLYDALSK